MIKLTNSELELIEKYKDIFNEANPEDFMSLIKVFILKFPKGTYNLKFESLKKIIFILVAGRYPEELTLLIHHSSGDKGYRFWVGDLVVNVEKFKQIQYEYLWEKYKYVLYSINLKLRDRTYDDVLNLPRDEITKRAIKIFRERCRENIPQDAHWETISDLMIETLKTVKIEIVEGAKW